MRPSGRNAAQQGYKPKAATIAKALLFPASIEALGDRGVGLSSEEWWSPDHPFKSGLTGQSAAELCAAFTKATGKQWVQPIGFKHALLEVAFDILKRTKDVDDPKSIVDAMVATNYQSIVGPVNFSKGPVKNVSTTPLVGGQWVKGKTVQIRHPDRQQLRLSRDQDGEEVRADLVLIGVSAAPSGAAVAAVMASEAKPSRAPLCCVIRLIDDLRGLGGFASLAMTASADCRHCRDGI